MSETLGITTYDVYHSKIFANSENVVTAGITIKSGESATSTIEGAILCKESSTGKYRVYALPTAKTKEIATVTPNIDGINNTFEVEIGTPGSIQPGSCVVYYTVSGVEKEVGSDNGTGLIESAEGYGLVDYEQGRIRLYCDTAPSTGTNITVSYNWYNTGLHIPAVILAKAVDASTQDVNATVYISGHFWGKHLTPVITDTYTKETLRKNGIIII